MAERGRKRPCGPGEHGQRIEWRKWKQQKKEEKKKWKDLKLTKKLERQRAQEEQAKRQEEEEAVAEREDRGRPYTLSIALPGSILDNAQSPELRTYLAGQIARACAIFCVDEIVVFDEEGQDAKTVEGQFTGVGKKGQACVQLARILQYLECPQYLRKAFFPKHQDLQFAGLLNPLDSPHHVRQDEESEFREGVVVDRPTRPGHGSFVNCGMKKEVKIDRNLEPGLRVTVRLNQQQLPECKTYRGKVVSSQDPRTKAGLYWGYTVRLASCLSAVFAEAPFQDGYDLTIGTSERGSDVASAQLPNFRHALVVFGGLQGLEAGVDADPNLEVAEPSVLFDLYVNTCPGQGSRTIRTEVSPPASPPPAAGASGSLQVGAATLALPLTLAGGCLVWGWSSHRLSASDHSSLVAGTGHDLIPNTASGGVQLGVSPGCERPSWASRICDLGALPTPALASASLAVRIR
ncbi:putative methyltransferase C9orf114 homolog isoform X2 [Saimiri boliviensis]|uniref:putative methyltransferase C9orf114 homolog isoform X2 n=1 Tax=Saimiri boliviensis TaxID=27679 RepID=UPI000533C0A2|nr:putative methyltransferase C9orf114 homolog isoform X2 [Saimiri boliviensis boliviensis]